MFFCNHCYNEISDLLTFSAQQTKPNICANSVDPDETARNEPSHQELHFFSILVLICRLKPLFTPVDKSKFKDGRVHFRN